MPLQVPAFDAKQKLSELLNRAQKGEEFTITRHGVPVARLVPVEKVTDYEAKKKKLLASLADQPVLNLRKIGRDEIYGRGDF